MKALNLILLLLSSLILTAQQTDVVKRAILKDIKNGVVEINSQSEAAVIINKLQEYISQSKDSVFINDSKKFIDSLESADFKSILIPVDWSKIDKKTLKNYRIKEDKFNKTIFIYAKYPFAKNILYIYPYICIKDNNMYLKMYTNYSGKDWVFMNKIIYLIDGETYEYLTNNVSRNVYTGYVSESSSMIMTEDILNIMRKIAGSNSVVEIRYSGNKISDMKMPESTKKMIREILFLFDELRNTKN